MESSSSSAPLSPRSRLQQRIGAHRLRRTTKYERDKDPSTSATAKLLSAQDRKRMARDARKKGVDGILQQFGVTDPELKRKLVQGIQNGTLGSYQELERFITTEKKSQETKQAAEDLPDTKIDATVPAAQFTRAKLRMPSTPLTTTDSAGSVDAPGTTSLA
jgi:hypothetical protein